MGGGAIQKQRNSNLELFRIIVMLLIIAHHYVVNSGVRAAIDANGMTSNSLFYYILGMWGKTGINCFVLITGWFMCTSKITLRKFLKLLFEVEFYKIVIGGIFLLTGKEVFSSKWVLDLLPVNSIGTGFVPGFLIFYLCIPFLNILINNISPRQHLLLIALLLFTYTILGTVPSFKVTMNYVSWFCVLYFLSSFMRLHNFPLKESNKAWLCFSFVCILLSIISVVAIRYSPKKIDPYWFVSDSNKILALLNALCLFNFFRTLRLPYSKLINAIGSTTFGVLLIHANSDAMRRWLWFDLFDNVGRLSVPFNALMSIGIILLVFIICACIDYARILLLEKPLFAKYDKMIEHREWQNE